MHPMMNRMIGYQANHEFDYRDTISMFLDMTANNVGDPFQRGRYTINSKEMEYAVIRYYAQLWNLPLRDISIDTDLSPTKGQDPDAYWGYVLSMGSSEGNIMAFWMARDYIAGKYLIIDEEEERIVTRMSKMDHQE
jgi:histidine decarboxylase